ncbi:lachesin-like isoform X2 [Phymastichus coffea]|uniref:lachesin-like isoform X2 n=1 Tax=Phymastichus coffea TaxID=108790 RepID=UPI00273C597E|nr:lachesin-like isoform X2 [Phymastichus coffea]
MPQYPANNNQRSETKLAGQTNGAKASERAKGLSSYRDFTYRSRYSRGKIAIACFTMRELGLFLLGPLLLLQLCLCQITPEIMPEFLAPLENHTVILGRDVSFTCVVNHLQSFRVAWIKSDSRAILAIHTHMVAHNPRLSVTHNGHNTWKLHISNVQKNDSGIYMCQVNTEPMLYQMGNMTVVVPPDIIDEASDEGGLVAHEGGNIKLRCVATGIPEPNVTWKREDGRAIVLRENQQRKQLAKYEGETLELSGVQRQEMGNYLCIASNGIPPTVSKRYSVQVQFQPSIKVTNHVVGAPVNKDVVLQCTVEASPQAMNTWYTDKNNKLLPSDKYAMSERQTNDYSWEMNLTIRSLTKDDFVGYVCTSENALGKAEGAVRLQELRDLFPTTTPGTQSRPNDLRPGRKKPSKFGRSRNKHEQQRHHAEENSSADELEPAHAYGSDENSVITTQTMNGNQASRGQQQRTERPHAQPSSPPLWPLANLSSERFALAELVVAGLCLCALLARRGV